MKFSPSRTPNAVTLTTFSEHQLVSDMVNAFPTRTDEHGQSRLFTPAPRDDLALARELGPSVRELSSAVPSDHPEIPGTPSMIEGEQFKTLMQAAFLAAVQPLPRLGRPGAHATIEDMTNTETNRTIVENARLVGTLAVGAGLDDINTAHPLDKLIERHVAASETDGYRKSVRTAAVRLLEATRQEIMTQGGSSYLLGQAFDVSAPLQAYEQDNPHLVSLAYMRSE